MDTTWDASMIVYYSKDADILSLSPLSYVDGVVQLSKGSHKVVMSLEHKYNQELAGFLYGLGYYKKTTNGYWHADVKRSSAIFYPALSVELNTYKSVTRQIELGIGYRYLGYRNDQRIHLTKVSANLYKGKWMFGYRATLSNLDEIYQYFTARFWIREGDFFIEANLSNSGETINESSFEGLQIRSVSYGVKLSVPVNNDNSAFVSFNHSDIERLQSNRNLNTWTAGIKVNF